MQIRLYAVSGEVSLMSVKNCASDKKIVQNAHKPEIKRRILVDILHVQRLDNFWD